MEVDERQRLHLVELLRDVLDDQAAETLMAYLPPGGWADVATKADLAAARADLAAAKAELRTEIADVRVALAELRGEVRTEAMSLRAEFRTVVNSQTRTLFFSLAGLMIALAAGIRLH
jgi:hypothetical protein